MRNRLSTRLIPTALATLAVAVFAAGCGSSNSTGPNGSLAGTWTLTTVNGNTLPALFMAAAPDTAWITQGTVVLTSTTWNFNATAEFSAAGVHTTVPQVDSGTYTVSGSALSLVATGDSSVTSGTVNGNTITVNGVGLGSGTGALTLVFQKQ
ncbi:MAG TPA: lipocalin family protein [Gemmatimonadales bacterium]|nr:lipocalin family protein [Gemmatimonadales bacterium]